ncbi:proline-rich acidic protein 1 isoform X2 [Choloepus didactylus]|uniref:proline-rich acidic protein 1 isoform X2 n=1 Tax=Choloepus didactylus TaxID=27675 RepID=UPI0018A01847|nr:proline-rich acidic protein 1 isoform X2 [Choloepus didactylus]
MRRLIFLASLLALLPREAGAGPLPQVSIKTKVKDTASEQDTEQAWDTRAAAPPKDDPWQGLLPLKAAAPKKLPDAAVVAEIKDVLGRFRSPRPGPELDRDGLYHLQHAEAPAQQEPRSRALLSLQVLQGPEEDRDHLYHPAEAGPDHGLL